MPMIVSTHNREAQAFPGEGCSSTRQHADISTCDYTDVAFYASYRDADITMEGPCRE
jgi:hypothetical protein